MNIGLHRKITKVVVVVVVVAVVVVVVVIFSGTQAQWPWDFKTSNLVVSLISNFSQVLGGHVGGSVTSSKLSMVKKILG